VPRFQPRHRLAAPIGVRSGIDGVLQHAVHGVVPRRLPNDFLCVFRSTHDGQLYLLLIQPEVNLSHAAQLRKLAKDQIDGSPDPAVGIFLDAIIGSSDVSNGHSSNQVPPLRHLHQCRLRTLAKRRHFHLTDRALNSQQQAIIREPGIIDRLGIDQKDADGD